LLKTSSSVVVDREVLAAVPVPEVTDSYMPVPHLELVERVEAIASDLLRREVSQESFSLARNGLQMFGVVTFADGQTKCRACDSMGFIKVDGVEVSCDACSGTGWRQDDLGLSLGFRNSYDRTMTVGVALGARVFVCDNLVISGEVRIVKKHSPGVWRAIEDAVISTLYRYGPAWENLIQDVETFKGYQVTAERGHEVIGRLIGAGLLYPRQIPVAFAEWKKPTFDYGHRGSAWQLYNAVTIALKTTPPIHIMERHRKLHGVIHHMTR